MKTFNVQKTVSTEKTTEQFDAVSFDNLQDAESHFNKVLAKQVTYAGEYNTGEFSEYYEEALSITSIDDETQDVEDVKSECVYYEGRKDKNNYKGDYPNWYWFIAKFNGTELIYNFYDNGKDLNIEYSDIKESELKNWYNY